MDMARQGGDAEAHPSRRRKKKKKRKSSKGALLKGMSRRLPIELLGDQAFETGLKAIMRGYAGVYALYDGNKLYYVGLANNLYNRLRWHTRDRHKNRWDQFAIFRVNRVRYLKDMETLLLQVSKPPGNSLSGHLHRDADLTRVLRKVHRENALRLRRLRKVFW